MAKIENIKMAWLKGTFSKLDAINISEGALALINKSELLKARMRAYSESESTGAARVLMQNGAAAYHVPFGSVEGFLEFSEDLLSTPEKLSTYLPMS